MGGILDAMWRRVWKVAALVYHHGWRVPKDIRGWKWAVGFWCFALAVLVLVVVALGHGVHYLVPLVAGGGFYLMARENKKPKKLGRPLPYRRRR